MDDLSGVPLFYPNLFIITQIRNRSLSYSSMEAALSGLSVLLRYMEERGEKIENRFQKGDLFKEHELDALRDFCQVKFRAQTSKKDSNGISTLSELREFDEKVSSQTEYGRLAVIAQYTKWLANNLLVVARINLPYFKSVKWKMDLKPEDP